MHTLTREPPEGLKSDWQEPDNLAGVIGYLWTILEGRRFRPEVTEESIQGTVAWGLERCMEVPFGTLSDTKEELAKEACTRAVRETSRLRRTASLCRVAEPGAPPEPEGETEQTDLRPLRATFMKEVWAALDTLPRKQQETIRLHYLEGLTVRQIAEREGVRMATVSRNKSRGLAKLRRLLAGSVPLALLRNRRFER